MSNGWMYILECADGSYYTGSTKNLELRLAQHQAGEGANHTKKRLPVELVYFEEFKRIDEAFYREKQVQGWSRKKKEALIKGEFDKLSDLSKNYTQFPREVVSTSSTTNTISLEQLSEPAVLPEPAEGKDSEGENVGFDKLNQRVSTSQMPAVLPEPAEGNRNPMIDQ